MTERINYECLPVITGPYVHATKYNKTLFVSGLTAYGTDAQNLDLIRQCEEILSQLNRILEQEKRSKNDLVKLTIFVRDISLLASIREQLFKFYEGYLPACSLVEVSSLVHPDLQIEIEAIVALESSV
ncbi:RidA family protein [Gynuella sunshinyii]|uniref:Putative translation initiation inhibitor, yjgF family n=1 Tax=Gynuella sunshinyii YC6258 TaxID=1445510 RepID=A0A0C5VQK4_9GAMM|nr:RidA family protein [Gynuella sunshinyii]AJQ96872.1 putative translation initiation inhibitor, yjgF family [Gynuella sunshinyii YC6258]